MKGFCGIVVLCLLMACSYTFGADSAKDSSKKKEESKPINKICPVEGGDVDPAVTTVYKGKKIGFCCDSCPDKFKKDPAKYMAIVDKELTKEKKKDKDKDAKKDEKKDDAKKDDKKASDKD